MSAIITRRNLLKSLAIGGAMASLPIFQTGRLMAAPGEVPLRIVFFDFASGFMRAEWRPKGLGSNPPTATAWELPEIFQALAPYKNRINFFQSLDMVSAKEDKTAPGNAHIGGSTHYLTGDVRVLGQNARASGVSIDQYIARQLAEQGVFTRMPSIQVGSTSSWLGAGASQGGVGDADEIYRRAFGSIALSEDELSKKQLAGAFIRGQHDEAMKRLGARDRQVIESHRDLRDDFFARLKVSNPERDKFAPTPEQFDALKARWPAKSWHDVNSLRGELLALILHSDSTRVASFGIERPSGELFGFDAGNWGVTDIHDLEHKTSGVPGEMPPAYAPGSGPYEGQKRRHVQEIAALVDFLDLLAGIPETDGKSLLDHTLVVCVSHISNGSHALNDLPWMVIGDAHGFFKTGQYVPYERRMDGAKYSGRAHNDLFVSLIQAMGCEAMLRDEHDPNSARNRFGLEDVCTGPISELHV